MRRGLFFITEPQGRGATLFRGILFSILNWWYKVESWQKKGRDIHLSHFQILCNFSLHTKLFSRGFNCCVERDSQWYCFYRFVRRVGYFVSPFARFSTSGRQVSDIGLLLQCDKELTSLHQFNENLAKSTSNILALYSLPPLSPTFLIS